MRVIVFFDLPTTSVAERRAYTLFRRHLIQSGFLMMQESVYCKLALNGSARTAILENLHKNKPSKGLVQVLTITEKQFGRMEYLLGDYRGEVIQSDERLIVL